MFEEKCRIKALSIVVEKLRLLQEDQVRHNIRLKRPHPNLVSQSEPSVTVGQLQPYQEKQPRRVAILSCDIEKDVLWELQATNTGIVQEKRKAVLCVQVCGYENHKE